MKNNPLVSVIIPNYCHARYLDERITSVLNQTYQNFEVIILDDCSPDDGASKAVIEKYRDNTHVSQIVYNEVNSGSTFKQWEKGFLIAKGELIWIAESDDYCELNLLEELVALYAKYPNCSFVLSGTCRVDSIGNKLSSDNEFDSKISYDNGIEFIKKGLICSNFVVPNASAVLFKRKEALEIKKDYMNYKASGDRLFWIYLAEKGDVAKVNKSLNYFRQHNNKVSPRKEIDGTQCRENWVINQYLHHQGYITRGYRALEFRYYWHYIDTFEFQTDKIRQELKRLWFPKWYQNILMYRLSVAYLALSSKLR